MFFFLFCSLFWHDIYQIIPRLVTKFEFSLASKSTTDAVFFFEDPLATCRTRIFIVTCYKGIFCVIGCPLAIASSNTATVFPFRINSLSFKHISIFQRKVNTILPFNAQKHGSLIFFINF